MATAIDTYLFTLSSSAFQPHNNIPEKYTCDGEDVSPPLDWSNLPDGTASVALTLEDPDAPSGNFVHWLLYNLPPMDGIEEGFTQEQALRLGAQQGINGFGRVGYGGPCPPKGDAAHRYYFTLYALDATLSLKETFTIDDLRNAMQGHILAEAKMMGQYWRKAD